MIAVKLARMTVTVYAELAFFWSHRENSKFLWTITKQKIYRSFNAIFGKIGRLASEEVIVHLISVKYLPVLMYSLDACPVCVSDKRSLDFIITGTFMKIFQTSSVDVVQECQTMFNFRTVSELILERKRKFLQKFCSCENGICQVLAFMATDELSSLCASLS